MNEYKRGTVTEENREESRKLRALWDARTNRMSQAEFGQTFDVGSQAAVGHFLNAHAAISMKAAKGFARGLGCDISAFSERLAKEASEIAEVSGTPNQTAVAPVPVGVPISVREEPVDGYVRLPVMAEASAGPGRVHQPEAVQPVDVLESYIRQKLNANPRNLKVLTARGGSMTGVIEDGDIMFVEPTEEFTDDGIYILTLDDLIRVKRLSISLATGNVLIESNDGRKAEELPLKEVPHRLRIQGRVLGAWSLRNFA